MENAPPLVFRSRWAAFRTVAATGGRNIALFIGRGDFADSHQSHGARPGAGRRRARRSRVALRSREDIPRDCPVLVTLRVLDDVPARLLQSGNN
ncbi:MAG: hypothetical protein OXH09_07200 [Gammaproteobacteria bacterium]|nr:hypothetical protein [Gammaproteobacteria bacterium]